MLQFLTVKITKNSQLDKNCLQAGMEIADQLKFNNGQVITLSVGLDNIPMTIKIQPGPFPSTKIGLNPQIAKRLVLSETRDYGIKYDGNRILIGPVIGIMANKSSDMNRPFGGQTLFISQLITQARKIGAICFAFTSRDVDLTKKTVQGYTFVNNTWKHGRYKLPSVIYHREKTVTQTQRDMRRKLAALGCRFVNPPWLGKWQSYKILSHNEALRSFIPDTRLVKSFKQVEEMISRYQVVYMKPIAGSQGKRIIRISKSPSSSIYKYQYQIENNTVSGTVHSMTELERSLKKVMLRQAYIVQQRIKLLEEHGRIIDLRVMTQKNDQGKWVISGMAFRIGKAGSITSNISSGGSGRNVNQLLNEHFPDPEDVARIIREIDFLALEAAKSLEKNYLPIGELGIDIGIDQSGKLWFIEANLKPARHLFTLIGEDETRLLTVQMPILYARYLAGFQ